MADIDISLSPEKHNANANATSVFTDDDYDISFHDVPSSPFVSHLDYDDPKENIAPEILPTPVKPLLDLDDDVPQSAFRVSPDKRFGTKGRASPTKMSPVKNLMDDFEEVALNTSAGIRSSSKKSSPVKTGPMDRSEPTMNNSRTSRSPSKMSQTPSVEPQQCVSLPQDEALLRDNEGLTVAMKVMEETQPQMAPSFSKDALQDDFLDMSTCLDNTEYNPDGPELTTGDVDDTCFSTFSEMPGLDMTKFAFLKGSPAKGAAPDATPRAHAQMTPSTIRRSERTPSPTPRRGYKDNDTTNLLLDFTAQLESFTTSHRASPSHGRTSPSKTSAEPQLRTYYQSQRSPAKVGAHVPSTPSQSRQTFNLLDFELPPPPTPRSQPTVTIRELESLKSQFQSQISSLTASLSGKEAEVDSLSRAVADAERRVGEALETVREERSTREHAEAQMIDWKKKGEEIERLLQDVQSELTRNETEREDLLSRLVEAERRADEAENRASELETKVIEAESKNVDMTTFINSGDDSNENKKIYSELECQAAIAEKVNEVARDLHTAYKAKHEKKIKALKDNYQKKADERCKELRLQIIRLERQVEEAEKKRDTTFSKISPENLVNGSPQKPCSRPDDLERLESQKSEIESLKAKLAGLQSELQCLHASQTKLLEELEAERVEKGELVAAAEQMLAMCGEKMEELQQEDLRRSQMNAAPVSATPKPREQNMRNTGFLAGGSAPARPGSAVGARPGSAMSERATAKPSGLRAPGGFGFGGQSTPGLIRSTSGGKSRLLSNIERMGGGKE